MTRYIAVLPLLYGDLHTQETTTENFTTLAYTNTQIHSRTGIKYTNRPYERRA